MSTGRRVMPSDHDYEKLNRLSLLICYAKNPQMFLGEIDIQTNSPEHKALVIKLEETMEDIMLTPGSFEDFINGLTIG